MVAVHIQRHVVVYGRSVVGVVVAWVVQEVLVGLVTYGEHDGDVLS
jgi:hypothetical protein